MCAGEGFFLGGAGLGRVKAEMVEGKKQINQMFLFPSCGGISKDGGEKG